MIGLTKKMFAEKFAEIVGRDTNKNLSVDLDRDTDPIAPTKTEIAGKRNGFFKVIVFQVFPEELYDLGRTLQMTGRSDTDCYFHPLSLSVNRGPI